MIDVAKGLSSGSYNINRELNPWTKLEGQNDAVSKKTETVHTFIRTESCKNGSTFPHSLLVTGARVQGTGESAILRTVVIAQRLGG